MFTEENRNFFHSTIGHRAIGVVYDPEIEQYGNYVPSRLSKRYDAFIYVEETHALSPLIF
jgi:erythromycin esterase-like protein